jgi:hypothetical protein
MDMEVDLFDTLPFGPTPPLLDTPSSIAAPFGTISMQPTPFSSSSIAPPAPMPMRPSAPLSSISSLAGLTSMAPMQPTPSSSSSITPPACMPMRPSAPLLPSASEPSLWPRPCPEFWSSPEWIAVVNEAMTTLNIDPKRRLIGKEKMKVRAVADDAGKISLMLSMLSRPAPPKSPTPEQTRQLMKNPGWRIWHQHIPSPEHSPDPDDICGLDKMSMEELTEVFKDMDEAPQQMEANTLQMPTRPLSLSAMQYDSSSPLAQLCIPTQMRQNPSPPLTQLPLPMQTQQDTSPTYPLTQLRNAVQNLSPLQFIPATLGTTSSMIPPPTSHLIYVTPNQSTIPNRSMVFDCPNCFHRVLFNMVLHSQKKN